MCSLHGDVHPMVDWIRKNYIPLTNKSKHKVEVFRWQATQIPKPEWWQFWGISLTLKQNVSCPVLIHSRDYWSINFRWIWVENLKTCKKGKILEIYTLFVVEWKTIHGKGVYLLELVLWDLDQTPWGNQYTLGMASALDASVQQDYHIFSSIAWTKPSFARGPPPRYTYRYILT